MNTNNPFAAAANNQAQKTTTTTGQTTASNASTAPKFSFTMNSTFGQNNSNNAVPDSATLVDLDKEKDIKGIITFGYNEQNEIFYYLPMEGEKANKSETNKHIMYTMHNIYKDEKDSPKNYSLLQVRFFDYVQYKTQGDQPHFLLENPKKCKGSPIDPNAAQSAQGGQENQAGAANANANANKPPEPPKDFSRVFQNQQAEPAPVNTSLRYFLTFSKDAKAEGLPESSAHKSAFLVIPKKKIATEHEKGDQFQKKVNATVQLSKNYDFLFDSPIASSSQFNLIDRTPITILEDKLKCGEPQNFNPKIEVISDENSVRLLRESYGSIDFFSPIYNINKFDVSMFVDIEQRYVNINCQLAKDYGLNLNKNALVTLENVFPTDFYDYRDNDNDGDEHNDEHDNEHDNSNNDNENHRININEVRQQLLENYGEKLKAYCEDEERKNSLSFVSYFPQEKKLLFYVTNFEAGPFHFPLS